MNHFAKALQMRGFFIVEEDGFIRLGKGSHPKENMDLKEMLEKLNVPATFHGQKITIGPEKLEDRKLHEIIWYPAKNHEAGGNGGWRSWKYFIKGIYGPKIRTITLETGVALFVKSLSAAGLRTISSCDGHGKRSPHIAFFGHYTACWFIVLYKNLLKDLKLHYDWEIKQKEFSDPLLIAHSKTSEWNLKLVQEDTYRMASFLFQNGQRISDIKRELFGANRNSINKQVKKMSFDELIDWMEHKYLEKHIFIGGL
jgi:hypothetical protein